MAKKEVPAYMRILGERVHVLRRRERYSQAAIAKMADMSPTTLSNLEQAKAPNITLEHLVNLAKIFGTTPDYLLGMERPARRTKRRDDDSASEPSLPGMALETV
jgi:transcriptional regulator with XRE-family HTH domain